MTTVDDPLPELIRSLRSQMPNIRSRSARALGRLGWLARDAIPLLVDALNDADSSVRESAAQAIGQMGPDALPHLVSMLGRSDKYVRRNAVWALGKLGPLAKTALPDLCESLRDGDPRTASGAAQALGNMGLDATEAIPSLTEAMRGTNIVLCRLASKALSQIGRAALPALMAHLRHRDPFVRGEAALALGWIGGAAATAVPALIDAARPTHAGGGSRLSIAADSATPTTPIAAAQATPPTEETSRVYAIQALGRIGPDAAAAVQILLHACLDHNDAVRVAAELSIKQIQGEAVSQSPAPAFFPG